MVQSSLVPETFSSVSGDVSLQGEAPAHSPGDLIKMGFGFWRRRYLIIVAAIALASAASLGYIWVKQSSFTGVAKVLFENSKAPFLQQQSLLQNAPVDRTQLANQIEELKSKTIAVSVIKELDLTSDPDFKSAGLLRSLSAGLQNVLERVGLQPRGQSKSDPLEVALAAFEGRLAATQLGFSNVVEINFNASSSERAAEIANAVANAFIKEQLNKRLSSNRTATLWLQSRLRELGQQSVEADQAVNVFKADHNVISAGGTLVNDQQVTDLNSRLIAARAATSDARVRLDRFETTLKAQPAAGDSSLRAVDPSNADVLNSPVITRLRVEYLDDSKKEAEWEARFGKTHLAVVKLRGRMKNIRAAIMEEVQRLAASSRGDYEIAKKRQEEIEKQLAQAVSLSRTTSSAQVKLRELEAHAKSLRTLYESLLQRYTASIQQDSFPVTDARIIATASPSLSTSKPKTPLLLALGLIGGLGFGVAVGLFRDITEGGFRTPAQVETILKKRCLSLVPLLKLSQAPITGTPVATRKIFEGRTILRGSSAFWAATRMPSSRFSESIRSIKLAIDLDQAPRTGKVIGITSSLPGEGKSTIAAALSQLMAHSGARTIVVDCDLRNPSLSRGLTPTADAGIADVISGKKFFEEIVWKDAETKLTFLPAVKGSFLFNSSEILSSNQMRALFDWLRENYDYVVVDLPPLGPIIDARVAATLIDRFVLAVEWGCTDIDVVRHALHTAPNVSDALIGVALTKTNMKKIGRYEYYHNDYYSTKHLSHYGITG